MKEFIGILAVAILILGLGATVARADGGATSYTVDSTFSSTTTATPFSAPSDSFTFTFSLPSTCTCGPFGSGFSENALVNFTFGGTSFTNVPATIMYAPSSLDGLFDIMITSGGQTYDWYLTGAQIYSVSGSTATLLNGMFPVTPFNPSDGSGSVFYDLSGDYGGLTGGTVMARSTSAVPEPSPLLLLLCGCASLVGLSRKVVNSDS
jgi:hypothetical protein